MPGVIGVAEGSTLDLVRALVALRHPVARGRLRADLGVLGETRSRARVDAALAQAVLAG
jgi:hypothetical protein